MGGRRGARRLGWKAGDPSARSSTDDKRVEHLRLDRGADRQRLGRAVACARSRRGRLAGVRALAVRLADQSVRNRVRAALTPQTTSLIGEINTFLDKATTELRAYRAPDGQRAYDSLILILDNLEKIFQTPGEGSGEASQRALFIPLRHLHLRVGLTFL